MTLKSSDFYDYSAKWSKEDDCYVATVKQFPSLAAHGDSKRAAIAELKLLVAEALELTGEDDE